MEIGTTDRFSPRTGVFATSVDDELVIFDPDAGSYFSAGPVGKRIWSLISDGANLNDVCEALIQEFEVERSICERDAIEFLDKLAARNLICKR